MVAPFVDRVWESCSGNPGLSGNFVLNGPIPGFQGYSGNISNGQTVYYEADDQTHFEVGVGLYSGEVIQRQTVYTTSNSGNGNVNFSGATINVGFVAPSVWFNNVGARSEEHTSE